MRRWSATIVLPLLAISACEIDTITDSELAEPVSPALDESADHNATILIFTDEFFVFDGDGNIVLAECDEVDVFTQSPGDNITAGGRCTVPNNTGQAVIWTPDNNPLGPGPCGVVAPDGGIILLPHWIEVVSTAGRADFTCWGP